MRKSLSIWIGVLFILCTASGIASVAILGNPHQMSEIVVSYHNENVAIIGILLLLLMSFTGIGISVCIYPLIKTQCPTLAIASVIFRAIEGVFGSLGSICYLTLLFLYQSGALTESIGNIVLVFKYGLTTYGMAIAFALGAMMYYAAFIKTNIVPKGLAIWGFIGAAMHMFAAILVAFGYAPFSPYLLLLNLPIALQEMVFAIWLIFSGLTKTAKTIDFD